MFASWSGMRGRSVWGKDAFKTLLNVIIRREWQKRTRNWFCYLWSSEVIPWTLAIVPEKPMSSRKGIAWWMWRRWLYLQVVLEILGSSSNDEGDGNENGKKTQKVQIDKTTTLHVHHSLLCISLLSLRDYDVKLPNLTCFWRAWTTTLFCFFWTLIQSFRIHLQTNSPTFWRVERDGINAMKFEPARTHFLTDVFVAVAVIVAEAPYCK